MVHDLRDLRDTLVQTATKAASQIPSGLIADLVFAELALVRLAVVNASG